MAFTFARSLIVASGLLAGCVSRPDLEAIRPAARPAPSGTSSEVRDLVAQLGNEDAAARERATAELLRIGSDPARQREVVEALRAGATLDDAESRARAGETLRILNRSESLAPWGGRMESTFTWGGTRVDMAFAFRTYADGSAEMDARFGEGNTETFSAESFAELAETVNEASEARGFGSDQFHVEPSGAWTIGPVSASSPDPAEHLVKSCGLWVDRHKNGWIVGARTVDGRAASFGLRRGDVILQVDGTKPQSIGDLEALLKGAAVLRVARAEVVKLPVSAGGGK